MKNDAIDINPDFTDLNSPETILNHVEDLKKQAITATPHAEILHQLIQQVEPIDFKIRAFPEMEELRRKLKDLPEDSKQANEVRRQLGKFKLKTKHYLSITIENILSIAAQKNWGLCKNHDFIYSFNGTYWNNIDKETFQKFLGEAAEQMGIEKYEARFYQFREQLFKQFLATAYLPTPEQNKETVLINLKNGTFEINPSSQSGPQLRPFERSDFLTYQLPFDYNPEAEAPLFKQYLNKVLPDKERQQILAEYLGYIFIRNGSKALKEEKALILYGTGANGKSVFYEVVNALLGAENVSNFSLQSLTNENGYFRAKIANKLVNYASEINGKLETATFKQMVSGEPVEARLPYGQPFTLQQYAKMIFNVNELPKDVEHTDAYFRRFLIIPFDETIPEEQQDKQLHNKIIEKELSGVFNWVLKGLNSLLKQKRFSDCEAAKKAIEQYKTESNSVRLFLDENELIKSSDQYKLIKELYQEYRAFCADDGITPFKKINFIKQIRALKIPVQRASQNKLAAFVEYKRQDNDVVPF
ncbi:MAG: DUF5906 domain-containing protein [Bacteroidales bacterium]|nr:DUF5906 domain-containing protein [Bacteroidales bacterium]MCF8327630.1 DUF5906 domain-containing protein [Bacteroidales bacterium]